VATHVCTRDTVRGGAVATGVATPLTTNATKHDVTTDEVESVFRLKRAVSLGLQTSPVVNELRLGLVGQSDRGRVLQVAFTFRGNEVRVISARPAHRKERSQYDTMAREIFPDL
jgi:uncharacterized DUF497 family protein